MCVQFHEQRLKGCQLNLQTFQQCFQPQSLLLQCRKRPSQNNDAQDGQAPGPAKQSRRESSEDNVELKVEQRDQEGGNSSSSESQDELPVHFQSLESAGRGPQGSAPNPGQPAKSGLTTYIIADGEDIVSSSGMGPDTGTDATLPVSSELAAAISGPRAPSRSGSLGTGTVAQRASQDQPPSQTRSLSAKVPSSLPGLAPSTAVKQELDLGDEDFAHALGREPAEFRQPDAENDRHGDEVSADGGGGGGGGGVAVKQEVVEDPCQGDKQQHASSLPRSAASPPLSRIRVESLQRQFEESFGIQGGASAPGLQPPGPHPVRLFAKTHSQSLPELVENFLLDSPLSQAGFEPQQQSPEGSGEGPSTSSVLRHLLTRPYGQAKSAAQESSPVPPRAGGAGAGAGGDPGDGGPLQPVDEDDSQSSGSDRQTGHRQKRGTSASQRHTENFLLTAGGDCGGVGQDGRGQSMAPFSHAGGNTGSPDPSRSEASAEENPTRFIKQEPEENVEDFSQTVVNSALLESDRTSVQNSSFLPEKAYHLFDGMKRNRQSLPQSSSASSVSGRQDFDQEIPPSPGSTSQASTPAMLPAEKLKSYSNMSLRDILTMRMETGENLVDHAKTSAEGEVVWECGFCHFVDHDKLVVLAHRQRKHTQHMVEAGLDYEDTDNWGRSSVEDEEWSNQGPEETEEASGSWAEDRPSTSRGHGEMSHQQSLQPWPPRPLQTGLYGLSVSREVEAVPRRSRARGFRHDDDFEYMSEESLLSGSGTEPEDLKDKNYIPPKSLALQEIISSGDEGEIKATKKVSPITKKRRGRPPGIKNLHSQKAGQPQERKEKRAESQEWMKDPETLYHCPFCHHPPASVQVLKNHLRRVNDSKHMLIVRRVVLPETLRYICPSDECNDTFSDGQTYLSHALQCQGHILDSQESSIRASAHAALEKVDRVAGFLNCPVSNCYFVSYFRDLMHVHLDSHVQQVRFSQMLLFRSICSAMAKTYAGVAGFDRYVCYCCNTILIDLPWVVRHMQGDHGGKVRGVLHIIQKVERKSRGIMVAVQCLKCQQRVPSLDKWFTHQCQAGPKEPADEAQASTSTAEAAPGTSTALAAYEPKPCIPPFEEWLWRTQSTTFKASSSTTSTTPASKSPKKSSSSQGQGQLPLIRSILLAQLTPGGPSSGPDPVGPRLGEKDEAQERESPEKDDDDDVLPMVLCDDCQKFVPEMEWKQHECFIKSLKALPGAQNEGDLHRAATDTAAAQPPGPSAAPKDGPSESPPTSHAKLLSALATRHQNDSSPSLSVSVVAASAPTPVPALTSTLTPVPTSTLARSSSTHPSLMSLLTKKAGSCSSIQAAESQIPSGSQPPRGGDGGMIRSLLTRSLLEANMGLELHEELQQAGALGRYHGGVHTTDAPGTQPRETRDMTANASLQSGRDTCRSDEVQLGGAQLQQQQQQQQQPQSAAFMLQNLADDVAGSSSSRTTSPGSSSGSTPAPLMSFLRQQGNQVMQVLGNIFDDQHDASLS